MSNTSSTKTDHKRHRAEARAYAGAADLPTYLAERILMEAMGLRNRAMCLELLDVWQARQRSRPIMLEFPGPYYYDEGGWKDSWDWFVALSPAERRRIITCHERIKATVTEFETDDEDDVPIRDWRRSRE